MSLIEIVKASYQYSAQEDNEISFDEGEELEVLYKIDGDWWLARDKNGDCGMIPVNYVNVNEEEEINENNNDKEYEQEQEQEQQEYEHEQEQEQEHEQEQEKELQQEQDQGQYFSVNNTEKEIKDNDSVNTLSSIPPPLPIKNPVQEISKSKTLKFECNALFLDSKQEKTKGKLLFDNLVYLCTEETIEHCYDPSELRDYDANELKLFLKSGEKIAIGLGKKDAKKFSELVSEISGYHSSFSSVSAPPLPRAPTVIGPKIPIESTKIPMVVSVSFEGVEGEEVSIFEGEEVYLLDTNKSTPNSQFARIEKVNGVSGLVPKSFIMTRSEYQKKLELEEAEKNELMTVKRMSEMNLASEELSNTKNSNNNNNLISNYINASEHNNTDNNNRKVTDSPLSLSSEQSKPQTNNAWSALAKTGTVPLSSNSHSSNKNNLKLENSRLWKDKSGKFQVEAEFISLVEGKVTILKASGSQVTVPLEILSDRDCEYACKRAGIPVPSFKNSKSKTNGTIYKGFDWLAFFLSVGIEAGKSREFGEKFASQDFEESLIAAFSSDFLSSQGMQMTEIYKILPEAAKRKAKMMQEKAKDKHRSNNSQMVLSKPESTKSSAMVSRSNVKNDVNELVPFKTTELSSNDHDEGNQIQVQRFPTIEELEQQGAIEMSRGNSKVSFPNGVSVSKSESGDSDNRIVIQPVEIDGPEREEYTRIKTSTITSTTVTPFDLNQTTGTGSASIALLQQQIQNNAMMQVQAQAQAQAQVQMQMRMQAQAQAQMQMRAQAQAQAQAQYAAAQQQQRMYQQQQQQIQQQQSSAPSVQITIHTGGNEKMMNNNPNPMTPPMALMNQPIMQMNNNPMLQNMGMMNNNNPMVMGGMNQMIPGAANYVNNGYPNGYNPFDPTSNAFYPNNNGFGF